MSDIAWLDTLDDVKDTVDWVANWVSRLSGAFFTTGNWRLGKQMAGMEKALSEACTKIDDATKKASIALYKTAEAGAWSTVETALVMCEINKGRPPEETCRNPDCTGVDLKGGYIEVGDDYAYQEVYCLTCGSNWRTRYVRTGAVDRVHIKKEDQ